MPIPRSSTIYDPFPAYRPPTVGGRRSRTNPYGLEDPTYNYLQALPYAPSPYTAGALRAGGEQDYAPSPYTTGALRPSRSAAAFNYGEPTPEGPPPPDPYPYASEFDRDFYSGQNLAPPSAPPMVAPAAGAMDPTAALLQQLVSWQAVNQSNLEEQRRIQQQQFQQAREDQQRQQVIASFGSFGKAGAAAPTAPGLAGQQMAARDAITSDRMAAQAQRNQLQDAYAAQQMQGMLTGAAPLVSAPPLYDPRQMGYRDPNTTRAGYYADEVSQTGPYNPRPQYISGPASGMSVDEGARNTMRGNQAFGLHVSRDNVRPEGGGAGANADYARLQRMAADDSPQGTANWNVYEQEVLAHSPQAELLQRGEEGGNLTPAERAYLMAMRLRRNRQT